MYTIIKLEKANIKTKKGVRNMAKPKITIAEIRAKNGKMTQQEFGNSVGVTPQTVNSWENDIYRISAKNLMKICEIYHVTSSDLLGT